MVKPTLALFFVVGPHDPSHGYFITNTFCNDGLMVPPVPSVGFIRATLHEVGQSLMPTHIIMSMLINHYVWHNWGNQGDNNFAV